MSTNKTDNFNLNVPAGTENYNIEDQNENMKIIDEELQKLTTQQNARVKKTTAALNYYVSPNGNDTNDGLTIDTPKKTIQTLINSLPRYLGHGIVINLAPGSYDENILLGGFLGNGALLIQGADTLENASNYIISSISVSKCSTEISIMGVKVNSLINTNIGFRGCWMGKVENCQSVSVASIRGIAVTSSNVVINNCQISNKNQAIYATENAKVNVNNCTGVANTACYTAVYNSTIGLYNNTMTGDSVNAVSRGGEIR